MKILILNHRFFHSGGPEQYMFNVTRLLQDRGHEVAHFSFANDNNEYSPFSGYFPISPYGGSEAVYYKDAGLNIFEKIGSAAKLFYNREVSVSLKKLISDFKPDVAYILQGFNFIFPTAVPVLYSSNIPIVVRVSDYQYICPACTLYRKGKVCEECKGGTSHSFIYKCLQDSYSVSGIKFLSEKFLEYRKIHSLVSRWMLPSLFTLDKMAEFGFSREKMVFNPTFFQNNRTEGGTRSFGTGDSYFLYVGGLREYKGVHVLVDAFSLGEWPGIQLKIIGSGDRQYVDELVKRTSHMKNNKVEFLGSLPNSEVFEYIKGAKAVIIPSVWYENLPNVLIESMSLGTPVIASKLGSLKEFIAHEETGILFEPVDESDLIQKLKWALDHPMEMAGIGLRAKKFAEETFSPERHYEGLIKVFKMVI